MLNSDSFQPDECEIHLNFAVLYGVGLAGNRQYNAHFPQQHHQAGAAGGKKRQADAGVGDGIGDDGNV